MPAVARDGDSIDTGHDCDGTSTVTGPSTDVFTNGLGTERLGDPTADHDILVGDTCIQHASSILSGSPNVYVNGIKIARKTDAVDIAGNITGGSPNVYANG